MTGLGNGQINKVKEAFEAVIDPAASWTAPNAGDGLSSIFRYLRTRIKQILVAIRDTSFDQH